MMQRRHITQAAAALLLGPAGWPQAARAQAPSPRRIAFLSVADESSTASTVRDYTAEFAAAGLVQGRDYVWDVRAANSQAERLPLLAQQLLANKPALILTFGQSIHAAMNVASDVPVVHMGDLVAAGLARSLRQPGGRATGVSIMFEPLNFKRTELLAELLPKGSRILFLADPTFARRPAYLAELQAAARQAGLGTELAYADSEAGIEAAFKQAARQRMAGVNQLNSPLLWALRQVSFKVAIETRLPAIYQWAGAAAQGGFMAYGPRNELMRRQHARIALRVFAGEKAGDIPIEQPTEIHLALNKRVAAQIGLKFPLALMVRADEVVE